MSGLRNGKMSRRGEVEDGMRKSSSGGRAMDGHWLGVQWQGSESWFDGSQQWRPEAPATSGTFQMFGPKRSPAASTGNPPAGGCCWCRAEQSSIRPAIGFLPPKDSTFDNPPTTDQSPLHTPIPSHPPIMYATRALRMMPTRRMMRAPPVSRRPLRHLPARPPRADGAWVEPPIVMTYASC